MHMQMAVHCMTGMSLVYVVGKGLLGLTTSAAWYLIHTLVNAVIVVLAWDDLVLCFTVCACASVRVRVRVHLSGGQNLTVSRCMCCDRTPCMRTRD